MNLKQYAQENGIALRTAYKYAGSGKLPVYDGGNGVLKVVHQKETLTSKQKKSIAKSVRQELDALILVADLNDKPATVNAVTAKVKYWHAQGIVIKGYNPKSIYRKISKAKAEGRLQRKTRDDKGKIRNGLLKNNFDRIAELAAKVYFENAQPNLNLTVDLIQQYAKEREEYFELAAISPSTLYRQLRTQWKENGFRTLHEFLNHYNKFKQKLPTVRGAFTDDIPFMQFIAGDDHKADVASVKYYNELTKKVEEKQVKIWFWNEAKTMMPLGWIIKVGDFTAQDLIESLSQVVMQYGLPIDNVLIDNGIGRSEEFLNFWRLLAKKDDAKFSAAYTPTNKATIERNFGIWKDEFDSFQKNYVSPHKEDARHSTAALSPEQSELFFEEYKQKLESYLTGFFIERKRTRIINGNRKKISIKDYYNELNAGHTKIEVTPQQLRFALSKTEIKKYGNSIKIGREEFIPPAPLPVSFNGQSFIVLSNPFDKTEIDLYAIDQIVDRISGEMWEKNDYIATLYNTRLHPEKRALVMKLQKSINKKLRLMAQDISAIRQLESPLPDTVAQNGELLEARTDFIKQTETAIKTTINALPPEINLTSQHDEKKDAGTSEQSYSLTQSEE